MGEVLEGGSRAGKSFCTLSCLSDGQPSQSQISRTFYFFFSKRVKLVRSKTPRQNPSLFLPKLRRDWAGIGWARVRGRIDYSNTAKVGFFHTAIQAAEITSHFTVAQLAGSSGSWLFLGAVELHRASRMAIDAHNRWLGCLGLCRTDRMIPLAFLLYYVGLRVWMDLAVRYRHQKTELAAG